MTMRIIPTLQYQRLWILLAWLLSNARAWTQFPYRRVQQKFGQERPTSVPRHPTSSAKKASTFRGQFDDDDHDDHDDHDGHDGENLSSEASDWWTSEFTLLNAPEEPHPELDPTTVALTCVRSLQWVDYPTPAAGLERCFEFFTWECRKAVTARQGANTVERFCRYGVLSPALQPFMGAQRVQVGENVTLTPAQPPLRGALATVPVVIRGAPIYTVQHMSGMERRGVAASPPETHMVIRLEQQRRPPMQGCWLVREVLDVRYAFAGDMGNAHVGG